MRRDSGGSSLWQWSCGLLGMVSARLIVGILVAASLTACVNRERTENEGRPPPGDYFVIVHLMDEGIELPPEIPAGTVSFEIENNGGEDHGFVLEGPGVLERIEELAPLERAVLTVNLRPGTYDVYSPIDDDRENGLEARLKVIEAPPSDSAGEQPGVGPSDVQDPIEDEGP